MAKDKLLPAGANVVRVRLNRTLRKTVSVYLGRDETGKDVRVEYDVDFHVKQNDEVKRLQEKHDDAAFLKAIVHKAYIEFTDENDTALPQAEQLHYLFHDPSHSAALISAYIEETVRKNGLK